jgi:flagellar basal body-associated protein FliL
VQAAALQAPPQLHAIDAAQDETVFEHVVVVVELVFFVFRLVVRGLVELRRRQLGRRWCRSELVSEDIKNKLSKERNLTSAEADKVLDKAADLMVAAEGMGHLSKADLKAGAAEVGIDPRYIDEAMEAVRRDEAAEKRDAARTKKRVTLAIVVAVTLFVLTGVVARLSLGSKMAEVDKRRAQLENVLERRGSLLPQLAQLRQRNDPNDKDVAMKLMDEITGATNRVATEKRRYNEAVVDYEKAASTPPVSWLRPLTGLPAKVPEKKE